MGMPEIWASKARLDAIEKRVIWLRRVQMQKFMNPQVIDSRGKNDPDFPIIRLASTG